MRKQNYSKSKRNMLIINLALVLSLSITVVIWFSIPSFIYPAYASTIVACFPDSELSSKSVILGSTNVVSSNITIEDNVNITYVDLDINDINESFKCVINLYDEDIETIRHEICHCKQFEKLAIKSCNQLYGRFLNELECYIKEEFPIYKDEIKEIRNTVP